MSVGVDTSAAADRSLTDYIVGDSVGRVGYEPATLVEFEAEAVILHDHPFLKAKVADGFPKHDKRPW